MIMLWIQSIILLILAFWLGTYLGKLLTAVFKPQTQPAGIVRPTLPLEPEPLKTEPVKPAAEPVATQTVLTTPEPAPEKTVLHFTPSSFGEVSQTQPIKRVGEREVRVSNLASLSAADIEKKLDETLESAEPTLLKAPEGGKADPLIDIIGIGPVNEKELNDLGIFHFWQIAQWSPEEIKWVSSRIKFPGRIVKENWMKQAAELMDKA